MSDDAAWLEYERTVHRELESLFRDATVRHNVELPGKKSRVSRQIDILVEESVGGAPIRTAVETKHYARRIDVKVVEGFIGLLNDIQIERGLLVSPLGYTEAAQQRAFRDDVDLDLDV